MFLTKEIHYLKYIDNKSLIINLINGATDIIDSSILENIINNNFVSIDEDILDKLKERKYLFNSEIDYNDFILELEDSINNSELDSTPNFLIIPTYACNLNCTYCYEKTYDINHKKISNDSKLFIDKQFDFIKSIINGSYNNKDILITLMGGEPLLKGNKEIIDYIFFKIQSYGYKFNIITNGVDLEYFLEDLVGFDVDHIQITLDGSKNIHDSRRLFYNGDGSFDKILVNIEKALDINIKVKLRVNVDQDNLMDIPKLADILLKNFGDSDLLYPYLYFLQDGGCSGENKVISEEVGIKEIFLLEKEYPQIKIFYKKFHPSSFINSILLNQKFHPSLRHCGASANQYVLDYKGNIYKCWHGIGNNTYCVGKFFVDYKFNENLLDLWRNRSSSKIDKCISCKYKYICGTGCPASRHKSNDHFNMTEPSCVDYEELINTILSEHIKNGDI